MIKNIDLAKDFHAYPCGRHPKDGDYNGEDFRKNTLLPALKEGLSLVINLDGIDSFADSFYDEAFGGLIREEGFSAEYVMEHITVVASMALDEFYLRSIGKYVTKKIPA